MNFVRSQPCPTCQLGAREQMDAVTSFVDLSHIYGLTDQESRSLRNGSGGASFSMILWSLPVGTVLEFISSLSDLPVIM